MPSIKAVYHTLTAQDAKQQYSHCPPRGIGKAPGMGQEPASIFLNFVEFALKIFAIRVGQVPCLNNAFARGEDQLSPNELVFYRMGPLWEKMPEPTHYPNSHKGQP